MFDTKNPIIYYNQYIGNGENIYMVRRTNSNLAKVLEVQKPDLKVAKEVKTTASVAFVILIIFYILFGVIF